MDKQRTRVEQTSGTGTGNPPKGWSVCEDISSRTLQDIDPETTEKHERLLDWLLGVDRRAESKPFFFENLHWKADDGRVTLAIDKGSVTFVRQTSTGGLTLEYAVADLTGTSWNPCAGWCPNFYATAKDISGGTVLVVDFGHLVGTCGEPFHIVRQISYTQNIFNLIFWASFSGGSYKWKPC